MRDHPEQISLSAEVLRDLEQWARLSGWTRHHVRAVEQFWRRLGEPRPFRVVDLGCGLGGLLDEIAAWGERSGVPLILQGVEPDGALASAAAERLGERATIHVAPLHRCGASPGAVHLVTCTLVLNRLAGPDRLRLLTEIGRVATTAYVFDVTPTVAGEVGARLIPWLAGLTHAPPEGWVRTLERAPTPDELARLVRHLPVEVGRVFPSAVCTWPEPAERVRVGERRAAPIRFDAPELVPGLVGADRASGQGACSREATPV